MNEEALVLDFQVILCLVLKLLKIISKARFKKKCGFEAQHVGLI